MNDTQRTVAKMATTMLGTMGSTRHTPAEIKNAVTVAVVGALLIAVGGPRVQLATATTTAGSEALLLTPSGAKMCGRCGRGVPGEADACIYCA